MPSEQKVPINAKIPNSLHLLILDAVARKEYVDKTDCIIKSLDKLLNNTHQEHENNTTVLSEKENEICILRRDLQEKNRKINELQSVIRELPNPSEVAAIKARDEVLRVLLDEKDRRIEDLNQNLRDLRIITYKQISQDNTPNNTAVILSNTQSDGLIRKICKNCGEEFETGNIRKETCSQKCRTEYSRKNRKMKK